MVNNDNQWLIYLVGGLEHGWIMTSQKQLGMENHPNWRSLQKNFRGRNQPPTSELSQLVVWPSEDRIFRKFRLVSPKEHHHYIYTEVKAVIDLSQSS